MPKKSTTKAPKSAPKKKKAVRKPKIKQGQVEPNPFFFEPAYIEPKMWCDVKDREENIVVCLYRCPDKAKCPAYYRHYDEILEMAILPKYIEKYGIPEYPVPKALIAKRKAMAKAAKEQEKADKEASKRKKKTAKEEKEEAKSVKKTRKVKEPAKKGTISKKDAAAAVKKVSAKKKPSQSTDLSEF